MLKKGCKFAASNQLKHTTMNNTEKTKVYYENATKFADSIYELFDETFAELPIVVYCVSVNRWDNHAAVEVWATIGNGKANDELREIVGDVCRSFSFSPWRENENASDFFDEIKEGIKPFVRRAKGVQKIVNKNKEQ